MNLPPHEDVMKNVPEHITVLLDRLHKQSTEQESNLTKTYLDQKDLADTMRDKFIALDQDKCQLVYALCRAINARTIVEAGTSFGVSTIYLALAAIANASSTPDDKSSRPTKVIATEHEPSKAMQAREYWHQCGEQVSNIIDLREGDLLETLKENVENVDLLLLDIWAPMALPTLKIIEPKLRHGAMVITDNSIASASRYEELLKYLRSPESSFINLTLPYSKGLELSIYLPRQ